MLKRFLLVLLLAWGLFGIYPNECFAGGGRGGSVHVSGYVTKRGTYVAPYYRTAPNHTTLDNWSTKGNINPYTGKEGTKNPTDYNLSNTAPSNYPSNSNSFSSGSSTNVLGPTSPPPAARASLSNIIGTSETGLFRLGILKGDNASNLTFTSTHNIPKLVGTRIVLFIKSNSLTAVNLVNRIKAPDVTDWGNSPYEENGTVGIFRATQKPVDGWLFSAMTLNEKDPAGTWTMTLTLDGISQTPVEFTVYNPSTSHNITAATITDRIDSAQDRKNLQTCLNGNFKSICNRSRLTPDQLQQTEAAELRVNLRTCLNGNFKSLCDRSKLTYDQLQQTDAVERANNLRTCLSANFKSLCDHSKLTSSEFDQVVVAEQRENIRICLGGNFPSLCDRALAQRTAIEHPELIP